jgi:hypothetical protein
MSHGRMIREGFVVGESNDKGPFKLIRVVADGKEMDAEVIDIAGFEGSPLKHSRVLLLMADDDDGKAFAIPYGPKVADRTDQQKPGEFTLKNHKRQQKMVFKDDGSIETEAKKDHKTKVTNNMTVTTGGVVYINC